LLLSREREKVAKERTLGRRWSILVSSDGPRGAGVPAPLFAREIGVGILGPPMGVKTHEYSGECWKVKEAEMRV
jgi:hypothetical protein